MLRKKSTKKQQNSASIDKPIPTGQQISNSLLIHRFIRLATNSILLQKNTSPKTKITMEQLNNNHLKIEYISYQQKMMIFQLAASHVRFQGETQQHLGVFFNKKSPPGHRRTRPRSSRLGWRRWWHDLPKMGPLKVDPKIFG